MERESRCDVARHVLPPTEVRGTGLAFHFVEGGGADCCFQFARIFEIGTNPRKSLCWHEHSWASSLQ